MTVKSRGSILYFSSDSSWAFGVFKGPQLLFTADRCQGWREQRGARIPATLCGLAFPLQWQCGRHL